MYIMNKKSNDNKSVPQPTPTKTPTKDNKRDYIEYSEREVRGGTVRNTLPPPPPPKRK